MLDVENINRVVESEVICDLNLSMLSKDDILNIALQRSEVLFDQRRSGIRQWSKGDGTRLKDVVEARGELLARRAAAVIYVEYLTLKPVFETLNMTSLADIGCGYAFFDLFVVRDFDCDLTLIDLEENDKRHFGFHDVAAAYSSLAVARVLLERNGCDPAKIKTLNPSKDDVDKVRNLDVAVSFLSCGFHYPVSVYDRFFRQSVRADGAVLLDLRDVKLETQLSTLISIGAVQSISAGEKTNRILLRKGLLNGISVEDLEGDNPTENGSIRDAK